MEPNDSSRKKRSSKAATPRRSTTSSTTGETTKPKPRAARLKRNPPSEPADSTAAKKEAEPAAESAPPQCLLATTDEVITLTREQQDEYLTLLTKGASPAAACQKLGVSITAVFVTMEQVPKFHKRAIAVSDVLSQNVAAQLYQTAMKGSVTAQTFYLRNQPPPEWPEEEVEPIKQGVPNPALKVSDERLAAFVEKARRQKNS